MHYSGTEFRCPHPGCDGDSFYCESQEYDGTHEAEDREYSWANVAEHEKYGIVVIGPDGSIHSPAGYRHRPDRWTTKKQRDADPDLARRVKETKSCPCICVLDYTWFKCSKCNQEIDADWAYSMVPRLKRNPDGTLELPIIYEEIGVCIINDYGVTRVEFD